MKKFIPLLVLIFLCSCSSSKQGNSVEYSMELVKSKKVTLPIDENTYYLSKRMFQYEEEGKELLFFGSFEKSAYEIILFDIEKECVHKRIPLSKEGPNAVPAIIGCRPFMNSNGFIAFQPGMQRISILDEKGNIQKYYSTSSNDGRIITYVDGISNAFMPTFMNDSVVYFSSRPHKPNMKSHEWTNVPLFSSLDLKTGKIDQPLICYPPIFEQDVKHLSMGWEFLYDYNYKQKRLVCSFTGYDSLMVTDDMHNVKWHDGKSRYLKSQQPRLYEAGNLLRTLTQIKENPSYCHIMYDKYRDVYYRFAEMPYELQPDESPVDDPKGREFSVIVFDKDFNIIGETKFPGNKYFYKMSFVGRDGLYISENNLANPEFDEDKLVFACFALEDVKEKREL